MSEVPANRIDQILRESQRPLQELFEEYRTTTVEQRDAFVLALIARTLVDKAIAEGLKR